MFKKTSALLLVCISICSSICENDDDLVVELVEPNGKIRGHSLESAKGKEYYVFQEIPYGKPPVGENRFRPPELHDDWNGILDCTKNTKICIQFPISMTPTERSRQVLKTNAIKTEVEESEDCLYLNVYTPVKPGSNNNLSVYFYIHGGAHNTGDGTFESYGPKYLIDGDIVIVTVDYRLGPLGYLSTGDTEISGNTGLKDQHLALEWTYKNIHLFGGNPQDIVMGGESSGATSVGYHLLSPRTKGLVSGYIQQSGPVIGVIALSSEPRQYAFELGRALDPAVSENTSSLVYALKKASSEELVRAAAMVHNPDTLGFMTSVTWEPVIEDKNAYQPIVTSPMHEDMIRGNFNRVPLLLGFNSEEAIGFLPSDESGALERVAAIFDANPSMLINSVLNVENRTLVGEKLKATYTSLSFQEDLEAFIRFTSDVGFIRATIRQAELASKHVPVYLYQLSAANNINDKYSGVSHAIDLRYFWDMIFPQDTLPVDEEIRETVLKLWWNFIKHKNPTPEKDPELQSIEWPTVDQGNIRYLNLNRSMSIETNPRNYNNSRNILLEYMRPTYYVF